jgi:Ca2+-binding RTX toxin-like protein
MAQYTQQIDGKVANGVRNSLFGFAGIDLAAIDIVRGDDHGVGSLNLVREGLGLSTYTSFNQFGNRNHIDSATLAALKDVYDNDINKLDTEVGGLMERKVKGSMLGETFTILNVMQFENIRDGDKFWYENQFKGEPDLLAAIKATSLADIIRHATGLQYVYHDAFAAAARRGGDDNANSLNGTGKGELVLGFGGIDRLHGRGGDDDVWGGAGSDLIYGDGGNDRLYGESDGDNLRGGGGKDIVSGGAGNDNLWGNAGRDTFHFVDGGNDHVKDFARNELIDLSDYAEFQKFADVRAHMTKAGSSVVIDVADGTIVLDHFNINKLGAGNFVYSEILDHLA